MPQLPTGGRRTVPRSRRPTRTSTSRASTPRVRRPPAGEHGRPELETSAGCATSPTRRRRRSSRTHTPRTGPVARATRPRTSAGCRSTMRCGRTRRVRGLPTSGRRCGPANQRRAHGERRRHLTDAGPRRVANRLPPGCPRMAALRTRSCSAGRTSTASLARLAASTGRDFDLVLAITRGGLVPAGMLAYRLDLREILVVGAEFYRTGGGTHDACGSATFLGRTSCSTGVGCSSWTRCGRPARRLPSRRAPPGGRRNTGQRGAPLQADSLAGARRARPPRGDRRRLGHLSLQGRRLTPDRNAPPAWLSATSHSALVA